MRHFSRPAHAPFEVKGTVAEKLAENDAVAGTNVLDGAAVPAGEIHVIQIAGIIVSGTASGLGQVVMIRSGADYIVLPVASFTSGVWTIWDGNLTIVEGDFIRAQFFGMTLNDDLAFQFQGYKFDAPSQ